MYKVFLDGNEVRLGEKTLLWQNRITGRLHKHPFPLARDWLYRAMWFAVEDRGVAINFNPVPPRGVRVSAFYYADDRQLMYETQISGGGLAAWEIVERRRL